VTPPQGSAFWDGARHEAEARDEGLSPEIREVRHCLESLARARHYTSAPALVWALARIYIPAKLSRRWREAR
jgi:hypothetical protein